MKKKFPHESDKYPISCKNCKNSLLIGNYYSCTQGVGIFPKSSKFKSCKKHIEK